VECFLPQESVSAGILGISVLFVFHW